MSCLSGLVVGVLALVGVVGAAPTTMTEVVRLEGRAIPSNILNDLSRFEQYAAAAYCPINNNSTGTKVTCDANICPTVEAADTTTLYEFQNSLLTDVTGFVSVDRTNSLIVVSFRGSRTLRNWISNLSFSLMKTDICTDCSAHDGFWRSWREARSGVLASVQTAVNANPNHKLIVTGHSLGGAIATLAAAQLRNAGYAASLYTYGAPRIGPSAISSYISNQGNNFRVTHDKDPVPLLPPTGTLFGNYVHISPEYFISSGNNVPVTENDVSAKPETMNTEKPSEARGAIDIAAHLWYFNDISGCKGGDILRREEVEQMRAIQGF